MKVRFPGYTSAVLAAVILGGCASRPEEPVIAQDDVVLFLDPQLRPEALQFPEYLLMEDFELGSHGRIPETNLIGISLKTQLDLNSTLPRCYNMLDAKKWHVDKAEMGRQSFRLLASKKGDTLEIRAVQGSGLTQLFILYKTRIAVGKPNG